MTTITPELITDLKRDEGCVLHSYRDSLGIWTIGYGHAHVAPGLTWTQSQADAALVSDVTKIATELIAHLPWITSLSQVRQDALFNMAFNLGVDGVLGFHNTLSFIQHGDYNRAADNMLQSLWARQVHQRANRLAEMIRTNHR